MWDAEGTLVLADLTGFTRLAEKLARSGRRGGEELVATITTVFTALLGDAAGDGDVLQFAGDGLLLFFDGPDHATKACRAALAMQRVLRRVGGIDSSRGRVRLRMSVGVHTGRPHFLLCGGDHLQLHVLGPDATTAARLEQAASAGDVLVSTGTVRLLDGATTAPHAAGMVRLRALPGLLPDDASNGPPTTTRAPATSRGGGDRATGELERFVPPPLRRVLATDEPESEHRRATIAFVCFGGVDELVRAGRHAEMYARVQELTMVVMDRLAEHGIVLTSADVAVGGGTFMLTAGAPEAVGDEETRMLWVVRGIVDADSSLGVRAGVHAGRVFTGAVGAPHRRTWSTMGDATNLASRLAGLAGAGDLLTTEDVLAVAGSHFAIDPVPALTVRGKARPVPAALVGAAIAAPPTPPPVDGELVGRDGEVAVLDDALAAVREGRGRVVEVVGAHGIGCSRLVAEARSRAPDLPWLVVQCTPYEHTSPFQAADRMLRGLLGIPLDAPGRIVRERLARVLDEHAPGVTSRLPLVAAVLGVDVADTSMTADIDPRFRRQRTVEAVAELVAAVAPAPGVVVVEDAERMDDASAELVAELLRRVPEHAWLALVTRSPGGDTGLHPGRGYDSTVLDLAPLEPAAATNLARRLAERHPVPPHLLPTLVERAAGSPLFLTELVAAQAEGLTDQLPRSVEAMMAVRIDALAPEDRRALRWVSVLGDRFTTADVERCLGDLGVRGDDHDRWARLDRFLERRSDGTLAFRNALVREIAYDGLPYARRRELHGRVADVLVDAPEDPRRALLPLHLLRAGRWAEAWDRAVGAGALAVAQGANAVAGELYDLALAAASHLPEHDRGDVLAVALAAGAAWTRAGISDRALAAYDRASAVAADPDARIRVLVARAGVHERSGSWSQALRLYGRARSTLDRLPPRQRARRAADVHDGAARARLAQGRPVEALDHARLAADAALTVDDVALQARSLHMLDRVHVALGQPDQATRFRDEALPLFAALGDLPAQGTVLFDLGADAQRAGQHDVALWLYERSAEVRTRAGDVDRAAAAVNAVGEVLVALGRPDEARERFRDALRTWRGVRSLVGIAAAVHNLGRLALDDGDPAGAIALLEEAVEVGVELGGEQLGVAARLDLGQAYLAVGRVVEAWDETSLVLATETDDPLRRIRAHRVRAAALEATGGRARAADERARAAALVTGRDPDPTVVG